MRREMIFARPTKCLLCNKYSDGWNTTVDREKHIRTEHLFDVLSLGIKHLVNAAFYNPDLVKMRHPLLFAIEYFVASSTGILRRPLQWNIFIILILSSRLSSSFLF
jgi:hypothetical protein